MTFKLLIVLKWISYVAKKIDMLDFKIHKIYTVIPKKLHLGILIIHFTFRAFLNHTFYLFEVIRKLEFRLIIHQHCCYDNERYMNKMNIWKWIIKNSLTTIRNVSNPS